jgi:RNA polymerase sigma-70 factor (ECF subfamily)
MVGLLPRLRRFARGLARDPYRADDLVQAACERALNRLNQVREGSRLDSWLYRIIYTRWIDDRRRVQARTANLTVISNAHTSADAVANKGAHMDTAIDMKNALRALPEEHRVALMLIGVEGYSYAEAAGILDVPPGTVASRVARARAMLGRLLSGGQPHVIQPIKCNGMEGQK